MKKINSGKIRDLYKVDEQRLLLIVSDRISAYDCIMPNTIPKKGILLNQMSAFWFHYISDIVPNHMLSIELEDFPKAFHNEAYRGRGMLVKKLKMIPIECIVRGYLSGSAWKTYLQSGEINGLKISEGMEESEKLPSPLFTPSKKADLGSHDENITFNQMIELVGKDLAEKIKALSIEIYKKCAHYTLGKGLILADTKFEFGLDENGDLVIADELLTPDSSRFWLLDQYKVGTTQVSLDKQYLRDWLRKHGYMHKPPTTLPSFVIDDTLAKYTTCYEKIVGKTLMV